MAIEKAPLALGKVMHTSKEEEGPIGGEGWVVLRALLLLVGGLLLVGYVIT